MNKQHLQHRPRYIAFVVASVDGRISLSSKHPPDWTSKEDWKFFQKSLAHIDAVVVGRNTYESVAERLRKRNTFVLSSRPKTLTRRGTVIFVNPAKVYLPKLLERYKSVAVVGGGAVYRFMLESKLLDEIFVTVEPLIFSPPQFFTKNKYCSIIIVVLMSISILHYNNTTINNLCRNKIIHFQKI